MPSFALGWQAAGRLLHCDTFLGDATRAEECVAHRTRGAKAAKCPSQHEQLTNRRSIKSETGWRQVPKSGSHCVRGRSRKLSRKHLACGSSFFNPPNPEQKLMEMEGASLQNKLSRNVAPPNTLNPKMKIPMYLQSPNEFWAGRWRRRSR